MGKPQHPVKEIPKAYDPSLVEEKWYTYWERHKVFHAEPEPDKEQFVVLMPPPNITGMLHMGHVLNHTLQDIYIRWYRMEGKNTVWIPGTDHAGIATQTVVEKSLREEGKTRHDLGREKFLEKVWEWRDQFGSIILQQLRKLGVSADWDRLVFTMDEKLSRAVREVFVRLYEKGLIYRGKRIINWDPVSHTALSDEEVEYKEVQGKLYYFKYPVIKNGKPSSEEFLTIATTRPETMLGDTAVAVHPKDPRYLAYIGGKVLLPLLNREIPVIADDYVDREFGTGVVKITPAHDPNDFEIGKRHHLEERNVMSVDATINENGGPYRGLTREEARKRIIADLEKLGLVERIENHVHSVGYSDRTKVPIEPYLSDQWFVKMKPLAEPALGVVKDGVISFHPKRWVKTYEHWMTNIRDWCISRQLWWGHRIPVFYCDECGWEGALREDPDCCPKCRSEHVRQDEDVLDTWFSSWLWPFSVHHWPEDNASLRTFYPTHLLVTGPDIIFFWVARMIMAGLEFMPEVPLPDGTPRQTPRELVPFYDVYFTSIVRDGKGRKMSKSLGNSPDPLDVVNTYGADALRYTITYLAPIGQDVLFDVDKCETGRNFANKIWNAARFLLQNKIAMEEETGLTWKEGKWRFAEGGMEYPMEAGPPELEDRWIVSRFHHTIKDLRAAVTGYRVNEATRVLYDFVWKNYCDWYIELIKERLYSSDTSVRLSTLQRALDIFETMLRMLHPFMPFLTEELWHRLERREEGATISIMPLPIEDEAAIQPDVEERMEFLQKVVDEVRSIRAEMRVPPSRNCSLVCRCSNDKYIDAILNHDHFLRRLARIERIEASIEVDKPSLAASAVVEGQELFIPLKDLIDLELEKKRLQKEVDRLKGLLQGIEKKLGNTKFVENAPKEVVDKERMKQENIRAALEKIEENLRQLCE